MKFYSCMLLLSLVLCVGAKDWLSDAGSFLTEAFQGAGDMWRAYTDMHEANYKHSDKYFHARGNYDAAQRESGGVWASQVISGVREASKGGRGAEDRRLDQEADAWGRSGRDPNRYRPKGLPSKY